jgi:hypothetical protein
VQHQPQFSGADFQRTLPIADDVLGVDEGVGKNNNEEYKLFHKTLLWIPIDWKLSKDSRNID